MMRTHRTPSLYSQDDPLSAALHPPTSESDMDRRVRIEQEAEARRISERIDEELRLERERLKKTKGDVKLLLLGQAESGKSTLQKQFQLMYNPTSMEKERLSWRIVVYYNVLRSVKQILATLETWGDNDDSSVDEVDDSASIRANSPVDHRSGKRVASSLASQPPPTASPAPDPQLSSAEESASPLESKLDISNLRLRLMPLVAMEPQLADSLSGGVNMSGQDKLGVFVRTGWQARSIENSSAELARSKKSKGQSPDVGDGRSTPLSLSDITDELVKEVANILNAFSNDVKELWEHPLIRLFVTKRRLKLDEWSEFFLNDILRVSSTGYIPTTDDILHARIQTMGVAEHVFDVNIHGKNVAWHLFDVGGARGQRHSWVPYFDDANAIIFVAPISAFDQYLDEDGRTNRIDDSLQLFTAICANPLLKNVHLVLFLNKTDILRRKLEKGLQVSRYITSYAGRPNEYESVVNYFRAHFLQAHKRNNENKRVLYTHLTSVVDTKTTQSIIANVRDSIFRGYLKSAALV